MKVLQLSSGTLSCRSIGGAERCCLDLSRWLVSSGVEVMVAGGSDSGERPFEPMATLRPAHWKPLRKLVFDYVSPGNVRRFRAILDNFHPDLVHVHSIYGIGSQLIHIASEVAPTIVTVHDYWPVDVFVPRVSGGSLTYPRRQQVLLPWVWAHRALHRNNLRGATLVSPSYYLTRRLERHGYRHVRVIPNGVALPDETTAGDARILFVGRLAPEKGLQEVLGVLESVAVEFGWQIDVVGDGPLRGRLERAFPFATFHGRADPVAFYRKAGIVVIPSLWPENFPYVALEAMAFGVPVLASAVGGMPEIVEDGASGRLYEPGATARLGAAIRELVADPDLRLSLGRAARERIERELTWSRIGPRYRLLYDEVCASTGAADAPEARA